MDKKSSFGGHGNSSLTVFVLSFFFLLLFRLPALFFPPYWDSLIGAMHEAVWLYKNQFDYGRLALEMPGFISGGPNVYFFTIYPTIQALMMWCFQNTAMYLAVNHLVVYALAAGTVTLFYMILSEYFSSKEAILGSVVLLSHPLFLSQSYAINMEMPIVFLIMLGIRSFLKNRPGASALWMLAAFAIKQSAALLSACLATVYLCTQFRKRRDFIHWILLMFPLSLMFVLQYVGKKYFVDYGNMGLQPENLKVMTNLLAMVKRSFALTADVYIILIAVSLGIGITLAVNLYRNLSARSRNRKNPPELLHRVQDTLATREVWLLCWLAGLAMLSATLIQIVILPRYLLVAVPCIYLGAMLLGKRLPGRAFGLFLVALIGFHCINIKGFAYRQISNAHIHNDGFVLERTLEYEEDTRLNIKISAYLEEDYADQNIIAAWPLTHMLAEPRFGYVSKPLTVVSADRPVMQWNGVMSLCDLVESGRYDPMRNVWVYSDSMFFKRIKFMEESDELLERITEGEREMLLFLRNAEMAKSFCR